MNLALVIQRAAKLFAQSNGRVAWRSCMERAALAVRHEARS